MAVTLGEYFKQSKDPLHKAFIADLLRYSNIMGVIPFVDINGLQVSGIRWNALPTQATSRVIGGGYTEGTGTTEPVEETLALMGGDVLVDRIFTIASNVYEDPLVTQMKMKAKKIAFDFNNNFINGDHGVDPDVFEGLALRVSNMPTRQTIHLDSNQAGTGDSLKVLNSTANTNTFLDGLDEAMKFVDGATHIFVNEDTYLKFSSAIRRTSPAMFDTSRDAFEREITTYKGVPLIDVGLRHDKSTEIITRTQDPGDGGNDATSLYVARIDTDDGLHGIQLTGTSPEPYDPLTGGERESGPQYMRRVDWACGLFNLSNYCLARVRGFRMRAT